MAEVLAALKYDSNGNAYVLNSTYKDGIKYGFIDNSNPINFRGTLQAHHLLQGTWAREALKKYGYKYSLAPTITLETNDGTVWKAPSEYLPHTVANRLQSEFNAQYGTDYGTLQERLIEGANQLLDAGIERDVVLQALEDNYKMIDHLNAEKIHEIESGNLERLMYSREQIEKSLHQSTNPPDNLPDNPPDVGRKGCN